MTDKSSVIVEVSPTFKRNIKALGKKYRSVRQDIEPVIKQLQNGELPGDRITGIGERVFKLRVKNSDISKGKKGRILSNLLLPNIYKYYFANCLYKIGTSKYFIRRYQENYFLI